MDVRATIGESGLNICRIIRLFDRPHLFYAPLLCSIWLHFAVDWKQLVTSYKTSLWGQLSLTNLWNLVILAYSFLEMFHLRLSEAAFSTIFARNFRQEVVNDVMSSAVVDPTGVKVLVKFGHSRSNCSLDIRLPHFVTNDDDTSVCRSSHQGKGDNVTTFRPLQAM